MIQKELPQDFSNMISSKYQNVAGNGVKVIFREESVKELWEEISWGQMSFRNRTEQGGLLVGYFCNAAVLGKDVIPWVEVCHIIACSNPSESREDFIRMSAENWRDMYAKLDELNQRTARGFVPVGWYHTHPNMIPARYSNVDFKTHTQQFTYEYCVGVVFNPHQRTWMTYCGPQCVKCESYLTLNDTLAASYGMRKNSNGYDRNYNRNYEETYSRNYDRNGDMEGWDNTIAHQRQNSRDSYDIFSYKWYELYEARPSFSKTKYEWSEIAPPENTTLKNDLCALAGMLKYNFGIMKSIDSSLEGIIVTGMVRGNCGNELDYQKIEFIGANFYHKTEELKMLRGDAKNGRISILFTEIDTDIFDDAGLMWKMMSSWRIQYLVLCDSRTDIYSNRYGFRILVK